MNQTIPTVVRLFALCLTALVVLIFAPGKARADEVTFSGSRGCFGAACVPGSTGQANTATLLGLTYNGSIFSGTTSMGFLGIGNVANRGANVDNLGSFTLTGQAADYNGQTFRLQVTFTAPPGITGGQSTIFTATLEGNVTTTDIGGVDIDFNNTAVMFTFSNSAGSGSFMFRVNDVSVIPGGTVRVTGVITGAQQTVITEPAALMLLGSGLAGLAAGLRKRYKSTTKDKDN